MVNVSFLKRDGRLLPGGSKAAKPKYGLDDRDRLFRDEIVYEIPAKTSRYWSDCAASRYYCRSSMPWLANEKRTLSAARGSAALRPDAAQSGLYAYLSLIALVGLALNALWHISWADPVAALAITPLILWETKESFREKACGGCFRGPRLKEPEVYVPKLHSIA